MFIVLRKERNNVFLCVVVCFFSRACVFFRTIFVQKQKKEQKIGGRKKYSQTSNDIIDQFSKDQIQRAVDKELL